MYLIFNQLPPVQTNCPSPAFSVLKSFLERNNIKSKIEYWNLLFRDLFLEFTDFDDLLLLPFLYILNEWNDKSEFVRKQIETQFIANAPQQKILNFQYYQDYLAEITQQILLRIQNKLESYQSIEQLVFGFSAKFSQWIPAVVLCQLIKDKIPDATIIMGGFGSKEASIETLKAFPLLDYAIWGEGEQPLLMLLSHLQDNKNDLMVIPRLVYRKKDKLIVSSAKTHTYEELATCECAPDFSDFFKTAHELNIRENFHVPVEISRGCHWNKCKFCFLNQGYKYRYGKPENMLTQIKQIVRENNISKFVFVDNDVIGKDISQFEKLLDLLIDYKLTDNLDFEVMLAEIIPKGLNKMLIEKMAMAGFKHVQIGYEALADSLLSKMNKKQRFADNLLFIKYARKYNIRIEGSNIITKLPDESIEDIQQSIHNLHFLRFFLEDEIFTHQVISLEINYFSRYFKTLSSDSYKIWNDNTLYQLLPLDYKEKIDRFKMFEFQSCMKRDPLWKIFEKASEHYFIKSYTYRVFDNGSMIFYQEYYENKQIKQLVMEEPIYRYILEIANDKVCSMDDIAKISPGYPQEEIKKKLNELFSESIIYMNSEYTEIISLIDLNILH